jgi:hypothetical protein
MTAPPRDQLGNVVAGDLGQEFIGAEEVDQIADLPPCVVSAGMVLSDFGPISPGNVIEP